MVEEYFRAKRDLLMDGDDYRDMIAPYPAYWSGLRRLELVILMDARVLGRVWPCQIMGRDPQMEEWAADTAPDVGPCSSCCQTWTTSGPYGRKYGLSAGVGAEASERRGTLVKTPRGPGRTRSWVLLRSRRLPTHQWRHCTWGKRSEAAWARGG